MARTVRSSKAKAAVKASPQRQTRARSRLANAPPLMTGLNARGQAVDRLPEEPDSISYAEAVERDLKLRQAEHNAIGNALHGAASMLRPDQPSKSGDPSESNFHQSPAPTAQKLDTVVIEDVSGECLCSPPGMCKDCSIGWQRIADRQADALSALRHEYETSFAQEHLGKPVPERSVGFHEKLSTYLKDGTPAKCDCETLPDETTEAGASGETDHVPNGLCDSCEYEWEEVAEFHAIYGTNKSSHRLLRGDIEAATEEVHSRTQFAAGNGVGYRETATADMDIDDDSGDETTSGVSENAVEERLPEAPCETLTDAPFFQNEADAGDQTSPKTAYPSSIEPDRGMNIFFLKKQAEEYVPDHQRQDSYDPARPQPIEVKPYPATYQPDHSDDEREYDPSERQIQPPPETSPYRMVEAASDSIGLSSLSPISPDINCVGCRLQQATSDVNNGMCLDCKLKINRRFSDDVHAAWEHGDHPGSGESGQFSPIEAAQTHSHASHVSDCQGADAGCWDARYSGEDGMQTPEEFQHEEDDTDWEVEEPDY